MDISEALKLIQEGKIELSETCELCQRKADGIGAFLPYGEFAKKIGQPEGKQRIVFYPSCSRCQTKLGVAEYNKRIEIVMQADMEGHA